MSTKTTIHILLLFAISVGLISHKPEVTASREIADLQYDESLNPWQQPNPIFRWPLPKVEGEAMVNVQFVYLLDDKSTLPQADLESTKSYLEDVFSAHEISFHFRSEKNLKLNSLDELSETWKTKLPSQNGQLTLYIIPDNNGGLIYDFYTSIEIVSDKAVVSYNNPGEFKAYAAKSLGHMLGLLPTYFENNALGVPAEDANNCGHAGDFVCDTPFDYLGLKNDVKKRNCKYKGDMGEPDTHNIMSNSWTECMDRITVEQANKIKYNLSVIPLLQSALNKASTIEMNVGMSEQPTINQLTLK